MAIQTPIPSPIQMDASFPSGAYVAGAVDPVAVHSAIAIRSEEVFPPDPPVAVLHGALSGGSPSYDAVIAEHVPLLPGGESCRSCGFVYTDRQVCPALILAAAGYPWLADRIRIVPAADPDHRAVCELTVAVERMGARLDVIGARVAPTPAPTRRRWQRLAVLRRSRG